MEGFGFPYHSFSGSGHEVNSLIDDGIGINASQTDWSTTFDQRSFHNFPNVNVDSEENESQDGYLEQPKSSSVDAESTENAPSPPKKKIREKKCKFRTFTLFCLIFY